MFRVPDKVTVRRPFRLDGALVPVGTVLDKPQVARLGRKLNPLLDNGTLVAAPDPFARKGKARPQPTSLPPSVYNAFMGRSSEPLAVKAKALRKSVSVEVTGGVPSFTVAVAGQEQSKSSRTFAFTVNSVGSHEVTVVDGSGAQASTSVVIVVDDKPKAAPKEAS